MKALNLLAMSCLFVCGAVLLPAQAVTRPAPIAAPDETTVVEEGPGGITVAPAAAPAPMTASTELPHVTIEETAQKKHDETMKRIWIASIGANVGANALDVISSWGKHENNPLLRSSNGTFAMKGLAIKSSIIGASMIPQIMLRDHKELRRTFAIVNFVSAAAFSGVALHNFTLPAVK
jgi:hypothetical protein